MLYHDGDFDEMKLCYQDYKRKLVWMGPNRKPAMLKRYLESYVKKKTVSPAAISSLSYVFTLAGLTEEKAAAILVSCCRQMGDLKIASTGKLLFLGSRILKSPQGKAALEPIKDMIKATYRDATVADTLVETSQQYVQLLVVVVLSLILSPWRISSFFENHLLSFLTFLLPCNIETGPWPKHRIVLLCWLGGRIKSR
jgi:hypothetical protein